MKTKSLIVCLIFLTVSCAMMQRDFETIGQKLDEMADPAVSHDERIKTGYLIVTAINNASADSYERGRITKDNLRDIHNVTAEALVLLDAADVSMNETDITVVVELLRSLNLRYGGKL